MAEKSMSVEELMALPKRDFMNRCQKWIDTFNGGKQIETKSIKDCPVAQYVAYNDLKCKNELVSNTDSCFMCGRPVCPDCGNHNVETISRVTGYLSTVSGWNQSKKQEFEDRNRYNLQGQNG